MTKPNLDEKLTAMMKDYVREKWGGSRAPRMVHYCETYFMAGAAAAIKALREVPWEFDVGLADQDAHEWAKEHVHAIKNLDGSALWKHGFTRGAQAQFERDKERIALAEARIAELTEAIVFSLRGLQMWRTYQSPGNIAEVEQRLRQALKRDGGSDE